MPDLYSIAGKKVLFALDAEQAHSLSIRALRAGLHPRFDAAFDKRLAVQIAGLNVPNPLGMAAGFDKGGDVPGPLLALGFGHTEVGTVTPMPQPGNSRPRIFRLPEDQAVINRLGFNSQGHNAVLENLAACRARGIVGVNIGANKESKDFAADYVSGIKAFAEVANYFTVNISSPNTPGLRKLQGADPLADLLKRVSDAIVDSGQNKPVFLKIAPDLSEVEMDDIAAAIKNASVQALIVSNTTLSRAGLKNLKQASQIGGLSGKPLFERSTIVLAKMYERLGETMPLIGVGGVQDAETAWQKIEAGATLVQLYTGLVYGGPSLPRRILEGLADRLDRYGAADLEAVRGQMADDWAKKPLQAG